MPRRRNRIDETLRASFYSEYELEEDLRPTLDRFAEDTSMLGFRYLHSKYKMSFRITWGLLVAFFVGLTIYQVTERIAYYFISNPLTTIRSFDAPTQVQFPALLICNKMQLKASRVAKYSQSLLKAMCYMHDFDGTFNSSHSLTEFDNIDLRDVYRNSLQSSDDLVLSCEYDKGRESCSEDVKPMLTPQGLCFTVTPNMTVRRPGPETTMTLLLNLEAYEIIPGSLAEPGVIVSLYDQSTPATAHFTEGIHLDAGKAVSIPINDVRKLYRHENHCGRRAVGPFAESEYTRTACQWVKAFEAIEKECHCVPILSPTNRNILTKGATRDGRATRSSAHSRSETPPCSLEQEVNCVENMTSHLILGSDHLDDCPEDCTDVSYSSVVFGGELSATEVASLVRTDWEEDKEKRLSQFMPAFEIMPNKRIPLVRAVQSLASEAQSFLEQALESLGVKSADGSTVPCLVNDGSRILDRALHMLHSVERTWKHIANYIQLVLSPHLRNVMDVLRLNVTTEFDVESIGGEEEISDRMIDQALFDLDGIETGLGQPMNTYGIRSLDPSIQRRIVDRILLMITSTRKCISEAKELKSENRTEVLSRCADEFSNNYRIFQSTRIVANSDQSITKEYEDLSSKLITHLQRLRWKDTPKVFEWRNFNIDLKEFETLYKDGGKDNQEIVELLKMRKIVHGDLVDTVSSLTSRLDTFLTTRQTLLTEFSLDEMPSTNQSIYDISAVKECLDQLPPLLNNLRRSSFLRSEWMSRVQRQVSIAQSYSPGTQYDEVNLLLVKVYYAHFKQETIVQQKSYNLFLLLAEIGGTIGLYVGATLLSIAETLVFFFEKRARLNTQKEQPPSHL